MAASRRVPQPLPPLRQSQWFLPAAAAVGGTVTFDAVVAGAAAATADESTSVAVATSAVAGVASVSTGLSATRSSDAPAAGAASATAVASPTRGLAAPLAAAGSVSADQGPVRNVAAAVVGTATAAAAEATTVSLAAPVAAQASVTAGQTQTRNLSAALAGSATVSATQPATQTLAVTVVGAATASAALSSTPSLAAVAAGAATIVAAESPTRGLAPLVVAGTANVSAVSSDTVSLAAAPSGQAQVAAALPSTVGLAATVSAAATVTADVQVSAAAGGRVRTAMLLNGPLFYPRLGEGGGTTAVDLGTAAQNGTYTGTPTLGVPSPMVDDGDTAVTFNPGATNNQYVNAGHDAAFNLTGPMTIVALITQSASGTSSRVVAKAGAYGFGVHSANNQLKFTTFGVKDYLSVGTLVPVGVPTHIAAVFDSVQDVTFYLNGAQNGATIAGTVNPNVSASDLLVGIWQTSLTEPFHGTIDEVAIYPAALTAAQIRAIYASFGILATVAGTASVSVGLSVTKALDAPVQGAADETADLIPVVAVTTLDATAAGAASVSAGLSASRSLTATAAIGNTVWPGTFEQSLEGWTAFNQSGGTTTLSLSTAQFHSGSQSMLVVADGTNVQSALSPKVSAAPGELFECSCWVYSSTGTEAVALRVELYNASDSPIGSYQVNRFNPLPIGWTKLTGLIGYLPSGFAYVRVKVPYLVDQQATLYIDDVSFKREIGVTPDVFRGPVDLSATVNGSAAVTADTTGTQSLTVAAAGVATVVASLSKAFPSRGILDNFNRANSYPLGAGWYGSTAPTGWKIASNRCLCAPDATQDQSYWGMNPAVDLEAYLTISDLGGTGWELALRGRADTAAGNWYELRTVRSTTDYLALYRVVAGVETQIGFTMYNSQQWAVGDRFGLKAVGNQIGVYVSYQGATWQNLQTVTDSVVTAPGVIGIEGRFGWGVDDFGGGALVPLGGWAATVNGASTSTVAQAATRVLDAPLAGMATATSGFGRAVSVSAAVTGQATAQAVLFFVRSFAVPATGSASVSSTLGKAFALSPVPVLGSATITADVRYFFPFFIPRGYDPIGATSGRVVDVFSGTTGPRDVLVGVAGGKDTIAWTAAGRDTFAGTLSPLEDH